MTSRAMLFHGVGQPLQCVKQSTALPKATEIRVRIRCCTICRSDLSTYLGYRIEATPTVLGHEVVGEIESFGPMANRTDATGTIASVGDRITWAIVANCGECFYCLHDLQQKCERGIKYGHHATNPANPDGGGLAETITLVPGTAWFLIPDAISTPVASLANCAVATAVAILDAAGQVADRSVLIYGAGLLGVIACAMTASQGAVSVIAIDPNSESRQRAIEFGATHALDPKDGDLETKLDAIVGSRGADIALELAGIAQTVEQCLANVRIGGTVILAGTVSPTPSVPLDPQQFVRKMLTLRGVHNYQPQHLRIALDFLASEGKNYPFGSLIAASFPLELSESAFAAAKANPGRRVAVISE